MKSVLGIVLVGLLARGAALAAAPPVGGLLRLEPSVIAANLNAGHGFVFEQYGALYLAWKEPLYILVLAGVQRWLGEGDLPVILLQSLFGIGAAIGVALVARHLLGDPARATVAGMIAAVNPFLAYYDTHAVHYLSLVALFFICTVGAILAALRPGSGRLGAAALAGAVMGLALWLRGSILGAGIAAWATAVAAGAPRERRRIAGQAATWLLIAALIILPWLARNYLVLGRVVFTTDFPHHLWLGNNPLSNGTFSDMDGRRIFFRADPAFQAEIGRASELGQYDLFFRETRRFIAEQPAQFAALSARRLLAFFWFSPNAGVTYAPWQNVVGRVAYAILLALGLAGLVRYWRRADRDGRYRASIFLSSVLGLAMIHALTAINMNHRVPLELALAVFAGELLPLRARFQLSAEAASRVPR